LRLAGAGGPFGASLGIGHVSEVVERTWTVLNRGTRYQIRDLDGQPISRLEAKKMIKQVCTVPDQVRAKARAHSAATNRAKLTR
jgi:hypothetical protein